jgi:hypothetical protein
VCVVWWCVCVCVCVWVGGFVSMSYSEYDLNANFEWV